MSTTGKTVTFKVASLRRLPDPVAPEQRTRYFAFCDVRELPRDIPTDTNPREQNLSTKVAKKIRESLMGADTAQLFHLLNRGILISADAVHFNNETNELTIHMPDPETHGLVDGGHTYKIIQRVLEENDLAGPQYVTLEIMTGVGPEFAEIAGARNTSVQVKDKSLANLAGHLDVIRHLVRREPFRDEIAYKENEDKDIDVLDVIALLTIFHRDLHSDDQPPVMCYSSKHRALQLYLGNVDSYRKLDGTAPEIFKLHDHIKATMWDLYNKSGGHLGKRKEIRYSHTPRYPLYYSPKTEGGDYQKLQYDIPSGYVYPILGALRYLTESDALGGQYRWGVDPIEFYDAEVGQELVAMTMQASDRLGKNPGAVGKDTYHWRALYDCVARRYLERKHNK